MSVKLVAYRERIQVPSDPPPKPRRPIKRRHVVIAFLMFVVFLLFLAAVDPQGGPSEPPPWMEDLLNGY